MSYDRRSEPRRSHSGRRANYGRHRGGRADQSSPDLRNQGGLDYRRRTYRNRTPDCDDKYRRRSPSGARHGRDARPYRYGLSGPYRRSATRSPERGRSRSRDPYHRSERYTQRDAPSARFGSKASYLRSRGTYRGASRSPSRPGRRQSPKLRDQDERRDGGSRSSSGGRYRERREDLRERDRRRNPPDRQFYRNDRSPDRCERSYYRGRNTRHSSSPGRLGTKDHLADRRGAEHGRYRRRPSTDTTERKSTPPSRRLPERARSPAFSRSLSRSFSGSTRRAATATRKRSLNSVHTPRGRSRSLSKDLKGYRQHAFSPNHNSKRRSWSHKDDRQKSDGTATRRSSEHDRRSSRRSSSESRGKADATPSRRSPSLARSPARPHSASRERGEKEVVRCSQQHENEPFRCSGQREDDHNQPSGRREDEGNRCSEQRGYESSRPPAQRESEHGRGVLPPEGGPSRHSHRQEDDPSRRSEQREDGPSRRSEQREECLRGHSEPRAEDPSWRSQQCDDALKRQPEQHETQTHTRVSPHKSADCPTPDLASTRSSGADDERRRAADCDRKQSPSRDEREQRNVGEEAQEGRLSPEVGAPQKASSLVEIQKQSAILSGNKTLSITTDHEKTQKGESPPSPSAPRVEAEDKHQSEEDSASRLPAHVASEPAPLNSETGGLRERAEVFDVRSGRDRESCSPKNASQQGDTKSDDVIPAESKTHSSSRRSPESKRRSASLGGSPPHRAEGNTEIGEITDLRHEKRSRSSQRSNSGPTFGNLDTDRIIVRRRVVAMGPEKTPVGEGEIYRKVSPKVRNFRAQRRIPGRGDRLGYSINRFHPVISSRWNRLEADEPFDHPRFHYNSNTSRAVHLVEAGFDSAPFATPYYMNRNMTPPDRLRGPFHQRDFHRAVLPPSPQRPREFASLPFERGRKQAGVPPGRGVSGRKHASAFSNTDGKWNHDLYEQLTNEPERKRPRFNLYGETLEKVED